jgi:hypothetical protein
MGSGARTMLCKESVLVVRWFVLLRLGRGFVGGRARSCIDSLFWSCTHDMLAPSSGDCYLPHDLLQLDDQLCLLSCADTNGRVVAL